MLGHRPGTNWKCCVLVVRVVCCLQFSESAGADVLLMVLLCALVAQGGTGVASDAFVVSGAQCGLYATYGRLVAQLASQDHPLQCQTCWHCRIWACCGPADLALTLGSITVQGRPHTVGECHLAGVVIS